MDHDGVLLLCDASDACTTYTTAAYHTVRTSDSVTHTHIYIYTVLHQPALAAAVPSEATWLVLYVLHAYMPTVCMIIYNDSLIPDEHCWLYMRSIFPAPYCLLHGVSVVSVEPRPTQHGMPRLGPSLGLATQSSNRQVHLR